MINIESIKLHHTWDLQENIQQVPSLVERWNLDNVNNSLLQYSTKILHQVFCLYKTSLSKGAKNKIVSTITMGTLQRQLRVGASGCLATICRSFLGRRLARQSLGADKIGRPDVSCTAINRTFQLSCARWPSGHLAHDSRWGPCIATGQTLRWSGFIVGSNPTPQTLNMHAHDLCYSHGGIFAILGGVVESLLTSTRHLC